MTVDTASGSPPLPGGGRRGRLIAAGVVVLVGLLVLAGVLWWAGGQRRANNVASFARAPVGCETTLDFERTGEFLLFVESTGHLGALEGQCAAERSYDREFDADTVDELTPGLALSGPDGTDVAIEVSPGTSYDVDGFVGVASWTVDIGVAGDHVLTVDSIGGDDFAIAVGRSPDQGVAVLRWGAVAASLVALVAGGALLVAGSRRTLPPVSAPPPWMPDGPVWPSSPPGFPSPPPTTGAVGPPSTPTEPTADVQPPAPPTATSPWGPPGPSQ